MRKECALRLRFYNMASGKTHDWITIFLTLPTYAVAYKTTQNEILSGIVVVGTLFGGLMFGPDLDIHSKQYMRWGPLRILWWPYKCLVKHRSRWSHGIILGMISRVVYFLIVVALLISSGMIFYERLVHAPPSGQEFSDAAQRVYRTLRSIDDRFLLAALAGIWWGAASHIITDRLTSILKR